MRSLLLSIIGGIAGGALAAPTCTMATDATLHFGAVNALASTGDRTTNSGTSLWVNCTSEVTTSPALYSTTTRTLVSGGSSLAFTLSAIAADGSELPMAFPGTSLGVARNGSNQTVTLYSKIRAADFKALPSGSYSRVVTLTLEY